MAESKPIEVRCDECGQDFGARMQAEPTPEGGELWWFRCPHCGRRYDSVRLSSRAIEIREELGRLGRRRSRRPDRERLKALYDELEQETERLG